MGRPRQGSVSERKKRRQAPATFGRSYAYPDLQADAFSRVKGMPFQRLSFLLVRDEVGAVHRGAKLLPPAGEFKADGGEDFGLEIIEPTGRDGSCVLTKAGPTRICYSCKSGETWLKATSFLQRDLSAKARPAQVLGQGGFYLVLSNLELGTRDAKAQEERIRKRFRENDAAATFPAGWEDRVSVLDAGQLILALQGFGTLLPQNFQLLLGIDDAALKPLDNWQEWRSYLGRQRGLPTFEQDPARRDSLLALKEALDAGLATTADPPRQFWILGPPGMGKTRLALEATNDDDVRHRVFYAKSPSDARVAIGNGVAGLHSGLVLVVDDVDPLDVKELADRFMAKSEGKRSVLIQVGIQAGPTGPQGPPGIIPIPVGSLSDTATLRLVASIWNGASEAAQQNIVHLCKGVPGFTVLLAQTLGKGDLGQEPPRTVWEAVMFALAGLPGPDDNAKDTWRKRAELRARVVLAAGLIRKSWDSLSKEESQRLARAFEVDSWRDLLAEAVQLTKRGIIRKFDPLPLRYVSPEILFTEAATNLLDPTGTLLDSIQEHAPDLLTGLPARLQRAGAPARLLEAIAQQLLGRVNCDRTALQLLGSALPLTDLANWSPLLALEKLRCVLDQVPIDELRVARDPRRAITMTLQLLTFRRVPFDSLEHCLFRLALAENEKYGNNATEIWKSLFALQREAAFTPIPRRFSMLQARAASPSIDGRRLATECLGELAGNDMRLSSWSEDWLKEGDLPMPKGEEVHTAMREAWDALIASGEDVEPGIASQARLAIAQGLRGGIEWLARCEKRTRLVHTVQTWSETEKLKARGAIDIIKAYDLQRLSPEGRQIMGELSVALRPESFHDRLIDSVGRLSKYLDEQPFDYSKAEACTIAADEALAREGLQGAAPLLAELPWLAGSEAMRSWAFMNSAGAIDERGVLVRPLEDFAAGRGGSRLLSAYIAGMARRLGPDSADPLLGRWRDDPRMLEATVETIAVLPPSDQRAAWLADDLPRQGISDPALALLAWGSWANNATLAQLQPLLQAMLARDNRTTWVTALEIAVQAMERRVSPTPELEPIVLTLFQKLSDAPLEGMPAHFWEKAGALMLDRRHLAEIAEGATRMILSVGNFGEDEPAWRVLSAAKNAGPTVVWPFLTRLLDSPTVAYRAAIEAARNHLIEGADEAVIMKWIGRDESRAALVARTTNMHVPTLGNVARALLIRFGVESRPASQLRAWAASTPGSQWGPLSQFYERQLTNALSWAKDENGPVATWAAGVVEMFQYRLTAQRALEEVRAQDERPPPLTVV